MNIPSYELTPPCIRNAPYDASMDLYGHLIEFLERPSQQEWDGWQGLMLNEEMTWDMAMQTLYPGCTDPTREQLIQSFNYGTH